MNYLLSRHSTYCEHVKRYVNYEISVHKEKGYVSCTATCTGIEESCSQCPVIQFNRNYPESSKRKLNIHLAPLASRERFQYTIKL
ncbi:hypothetical protein [Bacillus piscicola]|uniref:hypothetical protein n=1 Tax=Bacillus piscicola TaxID=1632684 RepID=UPI001F09D4EF|nr:hypothetical protein [Bacillus piscicola]